VTGKVDTKGDESGIPPEEGIPIAQVRRATMKNLNHARTSATTITRACLAISPSVIAGAKMGR